MALVWAALLLGTGCGGAPVASREEVAAAAPATPVLSPVQLSASVETAPTVSEPAEAPVRPFAPLASAEVLVELPIVDGNPAVLSLPLGSTSPRPVLVVTHGAGGSPWAHCGRWRAIVGDRGFILCTAGSRIYPYAQGDPDARFFYDGHPKLGSEIERALAALIERFGERVDPAEPIFAGFSQGASMGSLVLPRHPARFARAALVEGGFGQFQEWNIAAAQRFREQGGARVLIACGRVKCLEHARKTASYLRQGGLEAQVVYAQGAGHSYDDIMLAELVAAFPWLTEGDARW
jgi:predicted esterase